VGYDACPPYDEPVDFAVSLTPTCASSVVDSESCEPVTNVNAAYLFKLDERWNGDATLPTSYPPYVITTVNYVLHLDGNVLSGTADGSYIYDTPTTGGDCTYSWNVTATRN
jgi:hypothetical protein